MKTKENLAPFTRIKTTYMRACVRYVRECGLLGIVKRIIFIKTSKKTQYLCWTKKKLHKQYVCNMCTLVCTWISFRKITIHKQYVTIRYDWVDYCLLFSFISFDLSICLTPNKKVRYISASHQLTTKGKKQTRRNVRADDWA